VSSFGLFELWPLLVIAGNTARSYGRAVLSLDLGALVAGAYRPGQGFGYSIYALFHLLTGFLQVSRNIASGQGLSIIRSVIKLTTNIGIALLALVSNGINPGGPAVSPLGAVSRR